MSLVLILISVGCSSKVSCRPYKNFTILDRPSELKLTIHSTKKPLLKAINRLSKLHVKDSDLKNKKEIKELLLKVYNDDSKILALSEMKIKIKLLEMLLDQYETDISNYWRWLEK